MGSPERALVTFLVNSLWQAPLMAGLAWAGAFLMRRAPAAYRHRLWLAALALALLAPLGSALGPRVGPVAPLLEGGGGETRGLVFEKAGLSSAAKRLGLHTRGTARGLGRAVAVIYAAFLFTMTVRLLTGWRRTASLVAQATPPPSSLAVTLEGGLGERGRTVPVRVSDRIAVPMTFGLTAPVVVLPESVATRVAGDDLRGILAHELSHVMRRDCAVNLLCEVMALPLSWHPAIRWLRRRIGGAREAACDEAAAALVGPRVYARTLLDVAAAACRPARLAGALGVLDGDSLEERMKKILEGRRAVGGRAAVALLAALVVGLGLAGRAASAAAVVFTAEAGPEDMVGHWTGQLAEGPLSGQPAGDLTIKLTSRGPDIVLVLYRYQVGQDPATPGTAVPLPVVKHSVERGVLHFTTRVSDRKRPEDAPSTTEADWRFVVVGKDAGELTVLRNSSLEGDKASGKEVPPAHPLAMIRVPAAAPR